MRKSALVALASFALIAAVAQVPRAEAADHRGLPDAGSIITPTDGGFIVTVDTGHVDNWVATIRCRSLHGSPSVNYLFSADGGLATDADLPLDVDRTMDIPVIQSAGVKERYLSLRGEDGGTPWCTLHHQNIPSP